MISRQNSAHGRRAHRGFTTIEVLVAMTVFAIGAAGVIGMERSAIVGNLDARRLDVANNIAREWIERIRRDGMVWTNATTYANTSYISTYNNAGWKLPNPSAPKQACPASGAADGKCPAFDLLGRDLIVGEWPSAIFCTHIRIDDLIAGRLVRAQVRVFWRRNLSSAAPAAFCSSAAATMAGVDANKANEIYHFVNLATAVRMNPQP